MIDMLREMLSPRKVVGLHMDARFISAVQISNPVGSPTVDSAVFQEIRDGDHISHQIETLFRENRLTAEMLVTSLPLSGAMVREISLSFKKSKKLHRIIKYQMEPFVPYPIEDLLVGFMPFDDGRPILTMAVLKNRLSVHMETLGKAGLEPDLVSLDAVALYALHCRLHGGEDSKTTAVIHHIGEEVDVVIVDRGRIELLRVIQDLDDPLTRVKETFDLYNLKNPEHPVQEVLLTGSGESDESWAERLTDRVHTHVSIWKPLDHIKHSLGTLEADLQGALAVPLGLALCPFMDTSRSFNLRTEEFSPKKSTDLKGPLIYIMSALILLIGLTTFSAYQKLNIVEREYEALRSETRKILTETFPDIPHILKGREPVQMQHRIGEERQQYQWLDELTGRGTLLDVLLVLSRNLSPRQNIKVDNLSVERMRVNLDGRAPSFQAVDNLKGILEGNGFFKQVRLVGAKLEGNEKTVQFNFVLERKR